MEAEARLKTFCTFTQSHASLRKVQGNVLAHRNMWPTFTRVLFFSNRWSINHLKLHIGQIPFFLTSNEPNLDVCQLFCCVLIKTRVFWSGLDGWELIEVTAPSYLPRPTCFHLINIYGVVGPSAVVVKLDVSGHTVHLDLPRVTDRQTHTGECVITITLHIWLIIRCSYPWSYWSVRSLLIKWWTGYALIKDVVLW